MRALLFAILTGATSLPAIEPHPQAVPSTHKPGEVDVPANRKFIVKDPGTLEGIVLDETDAVLKGKWQYSTHTPPYVGIGYLHDQKGGKGEKSVTWTPSIPKAGAYEVRVSHCYNIRRATTTPVTIRHLEGTTTVRINQQEVPPHGKLFRSVGVFSFEAGEAGSVVISNEGTEGKYVIADAVQFLPVSGEPSRVSNSKATPLYVTMVSHFDHPWNLKKEDLAAFRLLSENHPKMRWSHLYNPAV